jgi:hypothetical protein
MHFNRIRTELSAQYVDHKRPVVCFDESAVQLVGEVRY